MLCAWSKIDIRGGILCSRDGARGIRHEGPRRSAPGVPDWTIAKPPRLTDAPLSGRVRADPALRVGLLSCISRSDLAAFLLGEVAVTRHLQQRVYVSR